MIKGRCAVPVLTVYMPSENDGDSGASSGSGCPSPAGGKRRATTATTTTTTTTTASKGILVHGHCSNKKSANVNRVSFVTNNRRNNNNASESPGKRCRKNVGRRTGDKPQASYHGRTGGGGERLTGFGVKSHLHEFYDDPEDRAMFQCDDFKYHVEPEIRWRRHCSGVYAILGLAVMTIGAATMAAGHLIPAKDPVVARSASTEVIDRWAVAYNEHLASCRYVGSVVFAVGLVFTVIRFWTSVLRGDSSQAAEKKLAADPVVMQRPSVKRQQAQPTVRIPITGSVESVQPDPNAINLNFGDSSQ